MHLKCLFTVTFSSPMRILDSMMWDNLMTLSPPFLLKLPTSMPFFSKYCCNTVCSLSVAPQHSLSLAHQWGLKRIMVVLLLLDITSVAISADTVSFYGPTDTPENGFQRTSYKHCWIDMSGATMVSSVGLRFWKTWSGSRSPTRFTKRTMRFLNRSETIQIVCIPETVMW